MGRSLKKGPFVSQPLLDKVDNALQSGDKKPIKTLPYTFLAMVR